MADEKAEILRVYFEQVESQVQFGDNKASLLIAGNAILLAISGGVIRMVSSCPKDEFTIECLVPSWPLLLAVIAALLLVAGLACALCAARPAIIHKNPPLSLFLFSYIAGMPIDQYVNSYRIASFEALQNDALRAIHRKAEYAKQKFRWLRHAIHATLMSLVFLVLALSAATVRRIFGWASSAGCAEWVPW